jgi:hypothetical protein
MSGNSRRRMGSGAHCRGARKGAQRLQYRYGCQRLWCKYRTAQIPLRDESRDMAVQIHLNEVSICAQRLHRRFPIDAHQRKLTSTGAVFVSNA